MIKSMMYRLSGLISCVLLTALVGWSQSTATQNDAGTSQTPIAQAQNLLNAGKAEEAIAALKAIVKSAETEAQINHLLGLAYYQKNDFQHAIEFFSLSVKQSPAGGKQYKQAMQLLATSHYYLGQVKEAIPYLEQVVSWMPENSEMNYALGVAYIKTQNLNKSREAFARMFAVASDSPAAYLFNAQMLVREKIEEAAEKELQKALALDAKLPQANFLLGEIAIYKANVDAGIELMKKEIALNPGFAMAYYRLGEALTRQQKWDESIAPLQKSIWLSPYFSGAYIVLGKTYLKKSDLANAEAMLRQAIRMDVNNFSAHHLLAQVLQQSNRMEEAKREFEIADKLRTSSEK
jgi:tetratricopeptide (TPR) repeat protein